jgi:hypothetical protein
MENFRLLHNEELNDLYSSPNIFSGYQIEKNEVRGACRTYGGEKRCIQGFGGETRGKDPVVDGRVILRWIFRT